MPRTYLYKLTSDRGGAPCAIEPEPGHAALLTLAICKPAIRRTAQPGDRILGLSSRALAYTDGYPLGSVIYAAVVAEALDARDYCAPESPFGARPDCIYEFHRQNGRACHAGRSSLHRDDEHMRRDLGSYPLYRNGRVLLCRDFRYFGAHARPIPTRLERLCLEAKRLGQGHRVYRPEDPEMRDCDALFKLLWKKESLYTPAEVGAEAYERGARHARRKAVTRCATEPSCRP